MNDMNDVQKIRRLLDERGVDYDEYSRNSSHVFEIDYCDACGDYLSEIEIFGACIYATKKYLTPEQAVAVMLDGEECEVETYHRCKHCGFFFEVMNVCPNCGNAVK